MKPNCVYMLIVAYVLPVSKIKAKAQITVLTYDSYSKSKQHHSQHLICNTAPLTLKIIDNSQMPVGASSPTRYIPFLLLLQQFSISHLPTNKKKKIIVNIYQMTLIIQHLIMNMLFLLKFRNNQSTTMYII
jgi:hypothetical protein